MVFLLNQINHQRLAFTDHHASARNTFYTGQDDTQSHSISIRPPTAKKDIMSFEETTSEHNFLQFSITDDENQITISSSSCESSENMSSDDTTCSSSDLSDQCPKISVEINNQHVNRSISIFGDLTKNPTFWEYLTSNLMSNDLELTANLSKLMFCLNLVEREFAWFYADHDSDVCFLDGTFMLNIVFLVYEQSEGHLMKLKSSICDTTAVFDLDLSEFVEDSGSDVTFEQLVESNLSALKQYLPSIIQINSQRESLEKGSGKDILNQLRDHLTDRQSPDETNKSELECSFLPPNLSNIDEALFEPGTFEFDSNPISTSYKPLVTNLKALNFLTYDPFREADELSAHYGTEVDICTLACLSFSYLAMGQLTMAKKCFFENTNQFLHELKSFYHEFECVFDDIEQNEANFSLSQFNSDNVENIDENSKWDYTETFDKQSVQEEATPLFDEILDRISSINEFGTQLSRSSSNNNVDQLECKDNGAPNWTVAPKLFTTNTIIGAGQQSYSPDVSSDLKSSCRVYSDNSKNKKNNNWNSKSTELRPIGTKSASMSSIRTGGYQNRHVLKINESSFPSDRTIAAQKEVLKNVWDHDSAEQETFSNSSFSSIGPYLFHGSEDPCSILNQPANADYSAQKNTIYKANVNTNVIKTTSSNNGKYSVAPLSFHSSSMEPIGEQYHQKTGHQFYRRQSIHTFYNSNNSGHSENSSPLTPDENHSSRQGPRSTHQRIYHKSFSSQFDDNTRPMTGDQNRPTVHHYNQQSSQRNSNRNYPHQQRSNFSKPNANVRKPTGGKTVYNSDAFNNDGSFRNSYSEGCSFPPKSRPNRRRY